MLLTIGHSAILATLLFSLSSRDAAAVPTKPAGVVTLPLYPVPRSLDFVHPEIRLQRRINRNLRRSARMSGREIPSDLDLRDNIEKRISLIVARDLPLKVLSTRADNTTSGEHSGDDSGDPTGDDSGDDGSVSGDTGDDDSGDSSESSGDDPSGDTGTDSADAGNGDGGDDGGDDGSDDGGDGSDNGGDGSDDGGDGSDDSGDGSDDGAGQTLPDGIEPVANGTTPTAPDSLPVDIESNDVGYFAVIQIGTPPRDFRVTIDSGSADFWVEGEHCKADTGGPCATDHAVLSVNISSSLVNTQQPWNITYGSGDVSGRIVTDTVMIDGLTLTNHTFGIADKESSDFSDFSIPYDGLIGLALSSLSNQGVPTPIEALAKKGLIKEAITSYKISRLVDGGSDGEITFGALDPNKFDSKTLITIPNVSNEGFWEGNMDAASVNGADVHLDPGRTAIFDTGTTGILAPSKDAQAIHAAISGAKSDGQGGFTLPCTTTAKIALTFGGQAFTIDPKDLADDPQDENNPTGTCLSPIAEDTNGDDAPAQWLLGDTFLKNVYLSTNVDKNSVSLAIPVNAKNSTS